MRHRWIEVIRGFKVHTFNNVSASHIFLKNGLLSGEAKQMNIIKLKIEAISPSSSSLWTIRDRRTEKNIIIEHNILYTSTIYVIHYGTKYFYPIVVRQFCYCIKCTTKVDRIISFFQNRITWKENTFLILYLHFMMVNAYYFQTSNSLWISPP